MLITPLFTVTMGPASVAIGDVFSVLASHIPGIPIEVTWDQATDAIVWQTRTPRILTGLCVGAILGVAGVVLQAIVRNPLAEPYVLGVSSGAGSGAAFSLIVIGTTSGFVTSAAAFVGAGIATFAVLIIAGDRGTPLHLILGGLAVGFGFQALTNLMIFSSGSPETNQAVMFWMLGSLARARWASIPLILAVAVIMTATMAFLGPVLDALASGDRTAQSVGIEPATARMLIVIPISAGVACAVAVAGGIGFVGLIIPHVMRWFIGHSHRALIVASAFTSGLFLVWTDAIARIVFAPVELPIGVITGLLGAPFLVALIRRHQRR